LPSGLREGRDEIARALSCKLPRLVTVADIKGHPARAYPPSDGVDTLETTAKAMLARGSEYFDVADHSKSAHYAGGLGEDGSEFHIQSDESDFLTDGSEHENQASSGWVRRAFRRRDEGCTGATLRGQGFRVGMLADLVVDRLAHGRREIMRVDKRIASPTRGARRSGAQGASW
jgi:hypothetical protein